MVQRNVQGFGVEKLPYSNCQLHEQQTFESKNKFYQLVIYYPESPLVV